MPPQPHLVLPDGLMAMPSITSNPEELRRRRQQQQQQLQQRARSLQQAEEAQAETALKAAVTARLLPPTDLQPLRSSRQRKASPLAVAVPTGVVFEERAGAAYLDEPGPCCGLRRDRIVWGFHLAALVVHLVMFVATLVVGANSSDPHLKTWRQQFLFVRNSSVCGRDSYNASDGEDEIVAVLVQSGGRVHVVWATAFFFLLSAGAHALWVYGGFDDRVGRVLYGFLEDCLVWTRWCEYSASASLMVLLLTLISGGRSEDTLLGVFLLMATCMFHGLYTELHSRPDPGSNGERWMGQLADGSNRVGNFLWRQIPQFLGWIPYIGSWFILINLYLRTLEDIDKAFGDRVSDFIPAFIVGALVSTFLIFSCFTCTLIYFQWLPPKFYWLTEPVYCVLSATAKLTLGIILFVNVLMLDSAEEGSTG